ncbi:MAG: tyrosine-type recombinase/integrase, partial [Candidatus Diapherotrites archaeon]|nr:tyrosine-type recombinase/integrase [Candidatus Diapherotrites archaeon]
MQENENALLKKFEQELVIAGYSPRTIKMYKLYAGEFFRYANKSELEVKREEVVAFLAHKKTEKKCSNATLALIHSSLKFLFHKILKNKILEEIAPPKKEKKIPDVLTKEEVRALIKATKKGRNRLLVEFIYSSGVRVGEVVKLALNNVDLREKTAIIKGGKGNKDRLIIISKNWAKNFKKHLQKRKAKTEF